MKQFLLNCLVFSLAFLFERNDTVAQKEPAKVVAGIPVNYNEDSVGTYTLPDLLVLQNGKEVKNADDWMKKRRPEIVKLIEENQFGKMPPRPAEMSFNVTDKGSSVMGGKAIRKQVTIYLTKDTSKNKIDLLVYLPAITAKPVPVLLNISFTSNKNTVDDPELKDGEVWTKDGKKIPAPNAAGFGKLNVDTFITQGIGIATLYYGGIEPDFAAGIPFGIIGNYLKPGTQQPAADEWGAISAWAWGLSRVMDYFETDKDINAKRVALFGISRLGKTVLWAGAHDTRFAMVIASCSGEGGAALARRNYGETLKLMSLPTRYFYQFCSNYQKYADSVDKFPIDAHMLVALMAPRPLLLQTGDQDFWSDPKGEFLAAVAATPIYNLFGKQGIQTTTMPAAGQAMLNPLGYTMHHGGHGTVPSDWPVFLEFIKKYL